MTEEQSYYFWLAIHAEAEEGLLRAQIMVQSTEEVNNE